MDLWRQGMPRGEAVGAPEHDRGRDGERGILPRWNEIVAAEGGEARPLITPPGHDQGPRWFVARFLPDGLGGDLARGRGRRRAELLVVNGYAPCWSSDGKWIFYAGTGAKSGNDWAVSIDGRTGPSGGPGAIHGTVATDGEFLYFTWQEDHGDIWVADVTY